MAQPPPAVRGGGARPSKEYYRRNLPHLQPGGKTLFVTFSTYGRWIIPEQLRAVILRHCVHDNGTKAWFHGAVVMHDHIHLVFTPLSDPREAPYGLAEILGGIKGASSHSINALLGRRGHVWQDESYDHVLRLDQDVRNTVEYVCQNPVRAGLAPTVDEYPWLWREGVEGACVPSTPAQPGAAVPHGGCE